MSNVFGPVTDLSLSTNRFDGQLDTQWSLDSMNPNGWQNLPPTTRSKTTYTSLPSGQIVWIRVRGVGGSTGFGPWSDPATKRVP